ncbi:MAG: GNAT family N-acetyltransferase [Rhodoglobus sp.]
MTGFRIRWAHTGDALGVATVHVASWKAAYTGLLDQDLLDGLQVEQRRQGWSRWIASSLSGQSTDGGGAEPHRLLVAESDDRVVGWASFGAGREPGMAHLGELAGLYVHPEQWSQHVGHALVVTVEEELRAAGWGEAYLWVLRGNDRAIRFYEEHSWNADGQEKFGDAGGATVLHELRHFRRLSE